ncbi:MAG: helix-turn-helix domain-containing protein [Gammaproteobacteria bacterium]|nr:helix-turn-helix domain-containing protein [Gammaproteobacteria bacterium]
MPPRAMLKDLSERIAQIMAAKGLSAKDLAKKAGIVYSTLTPILNGSRDCGVTKLAAIAEALECSPNELLYDKQVQFGSSSFLKNKAKYLVVFMSQISATYCLIYDLKTKKTKQTVMKFSLHYGRNPNEFIDYIIVSIRSLLNKEDNLNFKEMAIFISGQKYELEDNRKKIQDRGDYLFSSFIIESDAQTNYRALIKDQNAICIVINDGDAILFSTDKGKTISKRQGHGFPISDVAGNHWIGCEAIRHTIDVKEELEPSSPLSDKISAYYNDNLNAITEHVLLKSESAYAQASAMVKELMLRKEKSYQIVAESAKLLFMRVKAIDKEIKSELPIFLTGDLAYIYEEFFPEKRLMKLSDKHIDILLQYGIKKLGKAVNEQ